MNILLYTCFNERSISLESTILYFKNRDNVKLLTTVEAGSIHKYLTKNGIECFSSPENNKLNKHLNEIQYLKRFIKHHKIDIVHAHLQLPNFYSSVLRLSFRFDLLTVRHNSDVMYLQGSKKEILIEKIINKLSPKIVAISDIVKHQLIEKEKVNPKKIIRINNGYDFYKLLELSDDKHYNELKKRYEGKFIVLMPGRFIETKRHKIAIELIDILKETIPTIHLVFIGEGPERTSVMNSVKQYDLEDFISVLNFTTYIGDHYKLSNVIIQPSISEGSNNITKEALTYDKPVFACRNVGDFDSYLEDSLLLQKENPLRELEIKINELYNNPISYEPTIECSKNKMLELFSMKNVGKKYDEIHKSLRNNRK